MQSRQPTHRSRVLYAASGAALALTLTLSACGAVAPARPAQVSNPTAAPLATQPAKPTTAPAQPAKPTTAATQPAAGATAQPAKPTTAATQPAAGAATGSTAVASTQRAPFTPRPLIAPVTVDGAGVRVAAPLLQSWIEQYRAMVPELTLNYDSNAGGDQSIKDFLAGKTAFGVTDVALSDEQLKQAPDTLHVPAALDAVAVTYNLAGVPALRLSPAALAGIFQGTITKWSDPKIAADNPGAKLPDEPIVVVHRTDAGGASSIFSAYLGSVAPGWKQAAGTGTGAANDEGVAKAIKATGGSIGYVDLSYALAQKPALPLAAIKNAAGEFVAPSLTSVTAAAAATKELPADLRVNVVNPPTGADAYPISSAVWIVLPGTIKDKARAEALTDFLYWALKDGGATAEKLAYAPLSPALQQAAIAQLGKVTVDGKPAFAAPVQ